MSKKSVKRCIRPQCLEVYPEDSTNRYCDCGALLQIIEIETSDKKIYKPKKETFQQAEYANGRMANDGAKQTPVVNNREPEKTAINESATERKVDDGFDFFGEDTTKPAVTPAPQPISSPLGYLYLIPEDKNEEEIEFKLGRKTLIGRSSDTIAVDVDLSQFAHSISRKHALITYEEDGFYITNLSEGHSVHVNNKVVVNGQKMKLASEDGIILSKKVLLQFEEGE